MTLPILYNPNPSTLIGEYELQIAELQEAITEIESFLDAADAEFMPFSLELSEQVARLTAILADLTLDKENNVNQSTQYIEGTENITEPKSNPVVNIDPVDSLELARKCKRLYRQICIKCHPDKTKTGNLVSIMQEAKRAYDLNDYHKLHALFSNDIKLNLIEPGGELTDAEYIMYLQGEKSRLEKVLRDIQDTDEFELAHLLYTEGLRYAVSIRARSLRISITELNSEIYELENT